MVFIWRNNPDAVGTAEAEDWRVSTIVEKIGVGLDVASGSLQGVLKLVDGREYLRFS